ncbi:uncharacterized protein LOC128247805 [Octopus bimaculoides]|uniref:uncharacterized protein LOC128247805 n=1 Tax=Octopus bimaculoides TaxID=37653 RepID=UPI0022DF1966|nr:uncharacterized protein LOC128247805 [Octopus bimaculoides]
MEFELSSKTDFPKMGEGKNTVTTKDNKAKQSFSDTIGGNVIELEVAMEKLFQFRNLIEKTGEITKLVPPPETIEAIKKRTVVYKVYNLKEKKIMDVKNEIVERCLSPIGKKIRYVCRGVRSATIEAHFKSENVAKEVSTQTLKNEQIMLLPTYLGRRMAKTTVEEIPDGYDVYWVATAIIYNVERKLLILSIKKKRRQIGKVRALKWSFRPIIQSSKICQIESS